MSRGRAELETRSFNSPSMASSPLPHPNRHSPFEVTTVRVGASKSQASLARIIAVISTVRPPPTPLDLEPLAPRGGNPETALRVDLSLRLGLPHEIGRSAIVEGGGEATAHSVVGDTRASGEVTAMEDSVLAAESAGAKSSEGECDPSPKEEVDLSKEYSEITNVPEEEDAKEEEAMVTDAIEGEEEEEEEEDEEEEEEEEEGEEGREGVEDGGETSKRGKRSEGYLDLLLEAVRVVLGGFFDEEKETKEEEEEEKVEEASTAAVVEKRERKERSTGSKRTREASWVPLDVYEDTAPIVRSKRGRNQALPTRYRDSVLEPWTKPPTVSRHGRAAKH